MGVVAARLGVWRKGIEGDEEDGGVWSSWPNGSDVRAERGFGPCIPKSGVVCEGPKDFSTVGDSAIARALEIKGVRGRSAAAEVEGGESPAESESSNDWVAGASASEVLDGIGDSISSSACCPFKAYSAAFVGSGMSIRPWSTAHLPTTVAKTGIPGAPAIIHASPTIVGSTCGLTFFFQNRDDGLPMTAGELYGVGRDVGGGSPNMIS